MVKFYNKLQFRLTASFAILIILITGFSYFYTYNAAKSAIKQTVSEELIMAADIVSTQIDSAAIDKILAFKPGDDANAAYLAEAEYIRSFREKDADLDNFYMFKKVGDKILFILDDYIVVDASESALIGEEYTDFDPELLIAFEGQSVASKDFYTDKWGTFLSAYVPLKDDSGNVIAVLGTDMLVQKAVDKQNFIGSLIYIVLGLAIFAAALIIFFFSATIIRDINALTKVAKKLSNGDLDFELPKIKSKNEIQLLNKAMMSVLACIEFLKGVAEEKSDETKEDK